MSTAEESTVGRDCPAGVVWLEAGDAEQTQEDQLDWYDIRHLGVEGQGWSETKAPYDRLPAKAEGVVREPVWNLGRHSAGLCVRFVTDASAIHASWGLTTANLAMPHMAATGVSGVDLYVRDASGTWRWLAVGRPTAQAANTAALVSDLPRVLREYFLYLPLYNGTAFARIGIPASQRIGCAPVRSSGHVKPVVFYGTSITQGGCASRPGMAYTSILGRQLEVPVINLGFSGNGRMEPELAVLLAELDPCVYVLDCLANMKAEEITERIEPAVRTLRQAHPRTPILLVEDRTYAHAFLVDSARQRNASSRAALRGAYERLLAAGVAGLHYLQGSALLGEDGEGTVDGSHPTDLGFLRQAAVFAPVLAELLRLPG